MFGISLAELVVIFLIIAIFVNPKDLPEIARFMAKCYHKIKKIITEIKKNFAETQKEIGLEEIKQEFNKALVDEELKEEKITEIVDIYGNIHKVSALDKIRSDLTKEELEEEIKKHNQNNSKE